MNRVGLHSVTLKSFQAFRSEQTFRIAPLTLLFGPNSAGKSALLDALRVVDALVRGDFDKADQLLAKSIPFNEQAIHDFRIDFVFGCETSFGGLSYSDQVGHLFSKRKGDSFGFKKIRFSISNSELCISDDCAKVQLLKVSSVQSTLSEVSREVREDVLMKAEGTRWEEDERKYYEEKEREGDEIFLHELRLFDELLWNPDDELSPAYEFPDVLPLNPDGLVDEELVAGRFFGHRKSDNALVFLGTCSDRGKFGATNLFRKARSPYVYDFGYNVSDDPNSFLDRGSKASRQVAAAFRYIFEDLRLEVERILREILREVVDERGALGPKDLIGISTGVLYEPGVPPHINQIPPHLIEMLGIKDFLTNDERPVGKFYQSLCSARARLLSADEDPASTVDEYPLDRFNQALGALFPQQGYRLRVEITPIAASLERPATIFDQSLVELVLEDKNGLRLEFSSVGSAVSYLFPVVFAWIESETSYVMQPELHCHPALQLVLGDILVQRIACRKMGEEGGSLCAQHQYFVETHSEHIILRILKRIRECSEGKGPAGYEISPEDVSCIYVDPTEKGSIVTNIELTKGGDFFQDWPNGFFSERAGELF